MLDRLRHEDDGFTLVETLAAMIVFAILAVSVGSVILNTFDLTKKNASRVVAANLAAEQIEATRALRALDVPDGTSVTSRDVNGVNYRIAQNANLVEQDSGTSLCSGPSTTSDAKLPYKLVTVTVEWDGMGTVQPVRQDTLLSLGIGFSGMDQTKGVGAVAVEGASGQRQSGVTVTLMPGAIHQTTGADGCAVFSGLTPGTSYTASVDQPGYVSRSGFRSLTSPAFSVTAKGITRVLLDYERVGGLGVSFTAPLGLQPPAALGVTLSSAGFSSTTRPFPQCADPLDPYNCVSGSPRTAAALYPGQFGARAGTCTDGLNVPATTADVASGSTSSVAVPLAGAQVEVRDTNGPITGYTVYAIHAGDGVCLTQSWPMAPALASSQSLALPEGTWTFSLTPDGSALQGTSSWPSATLTAGQVTAVTVYK